jgi:hypothetical protein
MFVFSVIILLYVNLHHNSMFVTLYELNLHSIIQTDKLNKGRFDNFFPQIFFISKRLIKQIPLDWSKLVKLHF